MVIDFNFSALSCRYFVYLSQYPLVSNFFLNTEITASVKISVKSNLFLTKICF